jgi:hypothetical protein
MHFLQNISNQNLRMLNEMADDQIYAGRAMHTSSLSGDLIMLTSTFISRSLDDITSETLCMADNSSMR